MAQNKGKVDAIHDLLPSHFASRTNPNWKALVDAIGSADQDTGNLVAEVRKQFFVKTASRPYLDRLAANSMIARPRLVGMDDTSFREYIPVLSYKPKQVKLIIDQLLDIFFFKESTTAFITSQAAEPFHLQDGWELFYIVDEVNEERVSFSQTEFTDIANASANEIVAAINRQTKYSYATADYDSITKSTFIRIFTNTIGSKGSLRIEGGRANVALRFNGFIDTAGNGANTTWVVTKVGDDITFTYNAGTSPGINQLQVGDVVIINMPGNVGSFTITAVDLALQSITFKNLFGSPGTYTETDITDVKFLRPNKYFAYLNPRRAMTWETSPGEITVEMPTSPPVVKRSLKGSGHLNGAFSQMASRDSDTSMTVQDATYFPNEGNFWLEEVQAINSHYVTPSENTTTITTQNTRLIYEMVKYSYTSRTTQTTTGNIVLDVEQITVADPTGITAGNQVSMNGVPRYAIVTSVAGNVINIDRPATVSANAVPVVFHGNQLTGITPALPASASGNEYTNVSIVRTGGINVTVTTSVPHGYQVGEAAIISGSSGVPTAVTTGNILNGNNQITNLASVSGLAPDMLISGTGIPPNAKIVTLVGTTITMNTNATASITGDTLSFTEDLNGGHVITSVPTATTYTFQYLGTNGTIATPGSSRIERSGMAAMGSKVYITNALDAEETRILGPYIWDLAASFVLASNKGPIADAIQAGKIVRLLNLGANDLPATGGFVIFDYGLNTQEGPVRYLYKPSDTTIAIDPSYTFKHSHTVGSGITLVGTNGPHAMSTVGNEYPAYVTDPSQARIILEDLIRSVKSAGIFVNFLVRYPEQLYATLDVYNSGIDPG